MKVSRGASGGGPLIGQGGIAGVAAAAFGFAETAGHYSRVAAPTGQSYQGPLSTNIVCRLYIL